MVQNLLPYTHHSLRMVPAWVLVMMQRYNSASAPLLSAGFVCSGVYLCRPQVNRLTTSYHSGGSVWLPASFHMIPHIPYAQFRSLAIRLKSH